MQTVFRWLSCLTLTVVASKVTAVESNGILNPPADGVVEVFPVGAVSIDGQELELSIDFTSNISFEYTEDRFIRVFDSETNQQVFSFDPTVSHPSEGSTHLSVQVSSGLLESGKSYYITADPVFARLADDPWNAGEIVQGAWTFTVTDITDPTDGAWKSVPLLEPVAGINGVYPLGEADVKDLAELPLIIETVYPMHFAYTEGRMIRVIEKDTGTEVYSTSLGQFHPEEVSKSSKLPAVLDSVFPKQTRNKNEPEEYVSITGVEVFSTDPEPGHPDEGSTKLTINVPVSVLDTEKEYYVVADDLFARIDGEPWNIAHIPIGAWPLIPVLGDGATRQIQAARELLNSGTASTTDEEFNNSEFGKQQMDLMTSSRLAKAHTLALTSEDPQPAWFRTEISESLVVTEPATNHVLDVNKLDVSDNVIGQPSSDELRIEVRVQRGFDDFELVTHQNLSQYAFLSNGKLNVNVPADLNRGRLIVGLRPSLDDEGQAILAERWSAVVSFEVWPLRSGVISLSQEDVVFPYSNAKPFHEDLLITQNAIAESYSQLLDSSEFTLPMVVRGELLYIGDLVDYKLDGKTYSGTVVKREVINGQTLVLLSPTWFDVYDVVDASPNYLVEQGVAPEFLVYKAGNVMTGFDDKYTSVKKSFDESDSTSSLAYESSYEASADDSDKMFKFDGCSAGGSASLVFTPVFSLEPMDIGLKFSAALQGSKVECGFSAKLNTKFNLLRFTGAAGRMLEEAIGTSLTAYPKGHLKIGYSRSATTVEDNDGFKAGVGWTHQKGFDFKTNIKMYSSAARGVDGDTELRTGELGVDAGLVADLTGVSPDSWGGKVANWLEVPIEDVSISATAAVKAGLSLNANNIPAAYNDKGSSIALKPSISASIGVSATLKKLMKVLKMNIGASLGVSYTFDGFKAGDDFTGRIVRDDGNTAVVSNFKSNSAFLDSIFPSIKGTYVGHSDSGSSIYNDPTTSVTYDREECDSNTTNTISAPVIACMGPYCGKTQDLNFCSFGDIKIDDLLATGFVGEQGSGQTKVLYAGAEDSTAVDATLVDSLLTIEPSTLSLQSDQPEHISAKGTCYAENAYYGNIEAYADVGQDNLDEPLDTAESLLLCTPKTKSPRNVVWGSPHLSTADGFAYDYYASGDYILSKEENGGELEIQARFLPGLEVSWPQAAAMKVGPNIVEIYSEKFYPKDPGSGQPWYGSSRLVILVNGVDYRDAVQEYTINDKIIDLPGSGHLVINKTLSRFEGFYRPDPISVSVVWPLDGLHKQIAHFKTVIDLDESDWASHENLIAPLKVEISRDTSTLYEGMLGNSDGNPNNDLRRRNGTVIGTSSENISWSLLYGLFGGDWLVRPQECLFTLGCQKGMEFPEQAPVPSAENRVLAEVACQGLTGFYYDACVHDVGLTGEPVLVQEYYAETEDLNVLAESIIVPESELGLYELSLGVKENAEGHTSETPVYSQDLSIDMVGGEGGYMLLARPPKGASLYLSNGSTTLLGKGTGNFSFTLDCRTPDPDWEVLDPEFWPTTGSIQLWALDDISGAAKQLLGEVEISCSGTFKVLNDTGMDKCYSFSNKSITDCNEAEKPVQDGEYGRDVEFRSGNLTKTGEGLGSFDYSKISKSGEPLPADSEDWACIKDNVTGLIWESKKEQIEHLHSVNSSFSWYNSDSSENGGDPGHMSGTLTCYGVDDCNTESFVHAVNQENLCGYADWRLPTVSELHSLVNLGAQPAAIDTSFFPELTSYPNYVQLYWTSNTWFSAVRSAWTLKFSAAALMEPKWKAEKVHVRLVRSEEE